MYIYIYIRIHSYIYIYQIILSSIHAHYTLVGPDMSRFLCVVAIQHPKPRNLQILATPFATPSVICAQLCWAKRSHLESRGVLTQMPSSLHGPLRHWQTPPEWPERGIVVPTLHPYFSKNARILHKERCTRHSWRSCFWATEVVPLQTLSPHLSFDSWEKHITIQFPRDNSVWTCGMGNMTTKQSLGNHVLRTRKSGRIGLLFRIPHGLISYINTYAQVLPLNSSMKTTCLCLFPFGFIWK